MDNLTKNWLITAAVMGFAVLTMGMVANGRSTAQTEWHQYAVETVGSVSGMDSANGTLLSLRPGSALYLAGGSAKSSYQITTRSLRGSVILKDASADLVTALQAGRVKSMSLVLPVSALRAKESLSAMVKTLTDSSVIRFDLMKEALSAGKTDHTYILTATGTMTVAGQISPISLTADATIRNGQMFVRGVQKFNMADFSRVPHSDSLVVAKASDVVELHYGLLFEAN
jgi:hypothetical protein